MQVNLFSVPFEYIEKVEELKEESASLGVIDMPGREWFYYDAIPFGIGCIEPFRRSTYIIGPIWVAKEFRGQGLSTLYTEELCKLALSKIDPRHQLKILKMYPFVGSITERHLRNGWTQVGAKEDRRGLYTIVQKAFKIENGEYYLLQEDRSFEKVDFVFRRQQKFIFR